MAAGFLATLFEKVGGDTQEAGGDRRFAAS
jgi:hypothetical protein